MKGKLIMSVLLVATLCICCLVRFDLYRTYPKYYVSDFEDIFNDKQAVSLLIDNETPLEKSGVKPIDIHGDARYLFHSYFGTWSPSLSEVAAVLGQGCLRAPADNCLYSIYPTIQGGRLLAIYVNNRKTIDDAYFVTCFYIEKELSFSDFEGLEKGDSFSELIKIDSTAILYENLYNTDIDYFDSTGFGTCHYLSDGLVYINFETDNGIGEITDIYYIQDFAMSSNESYSPIFYPKLLPIDK